MGKERCGALNEVNSPLVAGSGKAGHVTDNPAAKRYKRYIAPGVTTEKLCDDALDPVKVLVLLAVLQNNGVNVVALESFLSTII